ncbi:MAG: glycosyl transferase family 1 [Rhodobacteraceae bacterium]|nr:glycosyl transferase family 1 [Paracoccaceae bacterium]
MLSISDIFYSVEGRPLLEAANANIPIGHKVGLVGRNGTGKTTLFKLIKGELTLDGGSIFLPTKTRIGEVAQEVLGNDTPLLNAVLASDSERANLLSESEIATDPNRIAEIQMRLNDIDAWSAEARASSILKGLGFKTEAQAMPCSAFSGGWRMRIALAGVLFSEPDLLLLDEPTNYLDLEGTVWLENYLQKYPHTVIIISHDRGLLNRSVTSILHLEDRKLSFYSGVYDTFVKTRVAQLATLEAEAKKQRTRRAHLQSYVDRFRYKADKARQAQSRIKAISRLEPITRPQEASLKRFTFPEPEELSPPILTVENGSVGYNQKPILSQLDLRIDQDDRIALLGQNGEGKSTLSKLISGRMAPMAGRVVRSSKLRVGYFAQHQVDELYLDETPLDHIKRLRPTKTPAQLRAILAGFGIGAEQSDTVVKRLSGGQKARLSLLVSTIDAPHLLILDEPTNHLDIESREALVEALTVYSGAIILVSHDMHLLSLVVDRLWLVKGGTVRQYDDDLNSYRKLLLGSEKVSRKLANEKPRQKNAGRDEILILKAAVRKSEARLEKLNEMREKLASKLADPTLYYKSRIAELETWNRKYAEVMEALERAEELWIKAEDKLESTTGNKL